MFNLILTIIAIALVVVLIAAGVYYGGISFNGNTIEAEAARYRTEASQIAGAVQLFKAHGNAITSSFTLGDLVDMNYLKTLPEGWSEASDSVVKPLEDIAGEKICFRANAQSGFIFESSESGVEAYSLDPSKGIPRCDKEDMPSGAACCVNP